LCLVSSGNIGTLTDAALPPRATLRTLLTLAWPIVIARATQSLMGFFDVLMVAPLGGDAIAATSTGALNSFSLVILPMGVAFIVQSFAAQLKGRGELVRARRFAWYGLMIAGASAVVTLAAIPLVNGVLARLDYTPVVRGLQTTYLEVRLASVAAVVGTEALGNWFSGIGNPRPQMRASLVMMAIDLPLNWLLIEGRLGAPALGVFGAALATSIGSWVGFLYMAWVFHRSREGRAPRLGLTRRELFRVLRFGLPNGVNWFLEFAAYTWFINAVMVHLGTVHLAALNVVFTINALSFMPAFGVATGGAILVGQWVGARVLDEVPRILRLTLAVAATWMGLIGLTYLVAPRAIFSLFVAEGDPQGPALLAAGAMMLALSTSWQPLDAIGLTLTESLRAAGDTVWALRARLVLGWGMFVPASYVLVVKLDAGIAGAIGSLLAYMTCLAAAFYYRYRSGGWKEIQLVEDLPPEALA
jgi:MATE family multidrug resistance protein